MIKKIDIICTLGPSSTKKDILQKMFKSGMTIARLNFSHGTHQEHGKRIESIREINAHNYSGVKILQDLEGYRIRIGNLPKPRLLKKDQTVFIVKGNAKTAREIPVDYDGDLKKIRRGLCVFIDDGQIALEVLAHGKGCVKLKVLFGGVLKSRKGVNIPGLKLQDNVFTQKDRRDLMLGITHKVDYVAQSFVRNKKDIERIVKIVRPKLPKCKIIAKIENAEGVRNLESIMGACDGIMIARGDLGVSVPVYKVAILQKSIIRKCRKKKKFVITATQMLEGMVEHNRPTRAEVADVTNAIIDGTDAVMLSAETAAGKHPIEAVRMMKRIVSFTREEIRKARP